MYAFYERLERPLSARVVRLLDAGVGLVCDNCRGIIIETALVVEKPIVA